LPTVRASCAMRSSRSRLPPRASRETSTRGSQGTRRRRRARRRTLACWRRSSRPFAGKRKVAVHVADPGDEGIEVVLREVGFGNPVDHYAVAVLLQRPVAAASREHMKLGALADKPLRQLANVARKTALDDRRVFPREQ